MAAKGIAVNNSKTSTLIVNPVRLLTDFKYEKLFISGSVNYTLKNLPCILIL